MSTYLFRLFVTQTHIHVLTNRSCTCLLRGYIVLSTDDFREKEQQHWKAYYATRQPDTLKTCSRLIRWCWIRKNWFTPSHSTEFARSWDVHVWHVILGSLGFSLFSVKINSGDPNRHVIRPTDAQFHTVDQTRFFDSLHRVSLEICFSGCIPPCRTA